MARKAELRTAALQLAEQEADAIETAPGGLDTATLLEDTAATTNRTMALKARTNDAEPANPSALSDISETSETSETKDTFGAPLEAEKRPALPAAAMDLIEQLANREIDQPIDEALEAGFSNMQISSALSEGAAAESAPKQDLEKTPEHPPTQPLERGRGSDAIDAFQLLLSSNPDADDYRRSDLRAAPSVRNPRKALTDAPDSQDPQDAAEAADTGANSERSIRNWFSPKQDPNPPPPPTENPNPKRS